MKRYKNILMVRLDRIGDVLLSTPAIKAVRDAYPESRISFMTRPYDEDVVRGNPYLNDVIIYDKNGKEKGLFGNLKFIAEIFKRRYDLAIILHPTFRTHLIVYLSLIPERLGYDKKGAFLLTRKVPHTKQFGLKHEIDYTLDLLTYIGIEPKERKLYMPVNNESDLKIKDIFSANGIGPGDKVLTINPGASCPSKRWKPENFAIVADELSDKYGMKVCLISGKEDEQFAAQVAAGMKRKAVNLAGMTTVADIASVLRNSRLFISNDSGPVHIACAVGTPVVAIFGRSDRGLSPDRWGPSGRNDIALHKDAGCEICMAHNCSLGFKCLQAVTPVEVVASASSLLEGIEKK
ncbi:MAG: lipopolysaccharide heptosyltransferase II [Candidatus Omnitrophota bacterium]|jgi:heptosyltransferase-2